MGKRKLDASAEKEEKGKGYNLINEEELDKGKKEDSYPYETVNDDHCETPLRAYQDIQQSIELFADRLGKPVAELKIYDPYYCEGNVVKRLNSLGTKLACLSLL